MEYDVEIIRLPIKHCLLNPIELAWAQLKAYVRTINTLFRLTDIHSPAQEYMAAVDEDTSVRFIEHARMTEKTFRKADNFMEEEMEPNLMDDDDENIDQVFIWTQRMMTMAVNKLLYIFLLDLNIFSS